MLIVTKHTGQLCNQIWSLIPVIAYIEQTHSKVCVFNAQRDYIELFPVLKRYKRILWIHRSGTNPGKIWRKITKIVEKRVMPFEGALGNGQSAGVRQINGWDYRHDKSYIDEQKEQILPLFEPCKVVRDRIKGTLIPFDGITVGVHIRRGDYKDWCDGAYYYSDEVYVRIMKELAVEAKMQGKTIRFMICSNEPFDTKQTDLNTIKIPNSDGIADLYGLASCDYIVGPPSSYSQWASFYGSVPLCLILQKEQKVSLKDFTPIVRLDMFADGKRLEMNEQGRFYIEKQ